MHEVAFPSISFNPSMITPACILNDCIHFTDFLYTLTGFRYFSMNLLYKRIEMNSDFNLGVNIVCDNNNIYSIELLYYSINEIHYDIKFRLLF